MTRIFTGIFTGTLSAPSPPPPAQQPALDAFGLPNTPAFPNVAVPAHAFLQSVGMNVWPPNSGSKANLQSMISYMGLRWIRGTIGPSSFGNWDAEVTAIANALNAANPSLGFKIDYLLNGVHWDPRSMLHDRVFR